VEEAEAIKKKYGHACPAQVPEDEDLDMAAFGNEQHQKVHRRDLAQVLHARVEEVATLVLQEIKRSGTMVCSRQV